MSKIFFLIFIQIIWLSDFRLEDIIHQEDVNYFLSEVEQIFPSFVAGILCDHHGFPIASKIPQNFHIKEANLALSAISEDIDNVNRSRYIKVRRDLNKSKNIKMLLLLERPIMHINRFKQLKELIEGQGLF